MRFVKYIAFLLLVLFCLNSKGQDKIMQFNVGATYHYGFILAHRNDVRVLVNGYTRIGEFTLSKRFSGVNDWEQKYAYPYFGTSLLIFDFSNPEQLGKAASLMAFYLFPLAQSKRFEFSFKFGFGVGYVENIFDKKDNYKNFAVSMHFNGFAYGNLLARYTIKRKFFIGGGISFTHFSNAAAKKPNLGLNVPAINMGVGYRFVEKEKTKREENYVYKYNKKWNHDLLASFGRKSKEIESGEYGVFVLSYSATKHVAFKSKFGGGVDLFYNSALRGEEGGNGEELMSTGDILQLGANVSYTLQIDRLSIFFNQGIYLYSNYKDDGSLYHRIGLRYLAFENLILNLSMKTHFAIADHLEAGLGYRF